jgi:hypothetical protein
MDGRSEDRFLVVGESSEGEAVAEWYPLAMDAVLAADTVRNFGGKAMVMVLCAADARRIAVGADSFNKAVNSGGVSC